jgi:large subunit ribosomal protein L17
MRHLKSGRKFGRESAHRKAMYRNLVTSLMVHGRIHTTEAKAKEIRRYAERVITLGKRVPPSAIEGAAADTAAVLAARRLHAIRQARKWVLDRDALNRVFGEYSERFKDRPGGYTRILKTGPRPGDNADMAILELLTEAMGGSEA